jgi:ATP-dependent Lon protease
MFMALTSLMTERQVSSDTAMTGEISLRGLVLPVGGIKEKVLTAMRAGITTVMMPKRNEKDLRDVPEEARDKLRFVFLETVDDAINTALGQLAKKEWFSRTEKSGGRGLIPRPPSSAFANRRLRTRSDRPPASAAPTT